MEVVNNIDIVQINVKQGIDEYYLPKNVNWRERKIDKVLLALPDTDIVSPIDGITHVLKRSEVSNLYFDLFASDDHQITRNLYFEEMLSSNNHPVTINEVLSLNLSRLYFSQPMETAGCLLLYVFYGTKQVDCSPAGESVTVRINLGANASVSLQEIVDTYIHIQPNKVKGIFVWNQDAPCYITLRNQENNRVFNSILSTIFRAPMSGTDAEKTQAYPLRIDNIDIDMLNSYVRNATDEAIVQTITFTY